MFWPWQNRSDEEMNFLIVGLGNIGDEYADSRHNMGFRILDALAKASNVFFEDKRYGFVAEMRVKNQNLILLKPSTYMNNSGLAVRYWMNKKKIPLERVLIVCDDIALPFGTLRMKQGGSEGGHNGLRSVSQCVGTNQYTRLRFGVGNDFPHGGQVDWVLGSFNAEELEHMDERVDTADEMIRTFSLEGAQSAMNKFNGK